jgi:hypothetical protein
MYPASMNDRQRQTEFLSQCLLYDDSSERQQLAERIRHLQHNERAVRRAVWLMILLAALAFAGLGYAAVFLPEFPQNMQGFKLRFLPKLFGAVGVGSLICIPVFLGLEMLYRSELNKRREECRRLATKHLEARLGKPGARKGAEPETFGRKADGANPVQSNHADNGFTKRQQ